MQVRSDEYWERLSDILTEMRLYSEEHFAAEEEHMRDIGFAGFENHRKLHREYVKKMAHFCLEATEREWNTLKGVADYLSTWWTQHIQTQDLQYGRWDPTP